MVSAVSAAATHFFQFRVQYSTIALLWYDYILTFPDEVKYMWRNKKWRLSSFLYIACRYALPANILYLLAIAHKLGSSCDRWYKIIGAISVIGRAAVITVFTMRTYAVCAQNRLILYVLGAIGLTCVVLDCLHVPGLRCQVSSSIKIANTLLSILICVFESVAAIFTVIRSFQAIRVRGKGKLQKHTLHYLLLEQGVLYFCGVSFFTIASVVVGFRSPGGSFQHILNAFTLPLCGLLTARFLLHIRAYDTKKSYISRDGRALEAHTLSIFQAVGGRVVSDFGEDPVTRAELDNEAAPEHIAMCDATLQRGRGEDIEEQDRGFVHGSSPLVTTV